MKEKEIHPKYLPTRLPIWPTLIMWLFLDRLGNPPLGWGIVGTLMALIWVACIYNLVTRQWVKPNEI